MNFPSFSNFNNNYTSFTNNNIKTNAFKQEPDYVLYNETKPTKNKPSKQNCHDKAIMATQGIFNGININKDKINDVIHPVVQLFFSDKNTNKIQALIKKEIKNRTKGKYVLEDDQDENDLMIAMRAVMFDSDRGARYLPDNIEKQVALLNYNVVQYIVPDMIVAIQQYYGYIKEINEPLKPLLRPLNVNSAGRKTLPSVTTIYDI